MAIEHWITAHLLGANASFQRAAREYAEEYAAIAVAAAEAAERERWTVPAAMAVQELAHCATWTAGGVACNLLREVLRPNVANNRIPTA